MTGELAKEPTSRACVEKWHAVFVRQQDVTHWIAYIFLLVQALFVPAYVQAVKDPMLGIVIATFALLHAGGWWAVGHRTEGRTARIRTKVMDVEGRCEAAEFRIYREMQRWDDDQKPLVRQIHVMNAGLPLAWIVFWAVIFIMKLS
jgi:hypothetical protein